VVEGSERPPEGAPLVIQVLDTTYADAPSRLLDEAKSSVQGGQGPLLRTVELGYQPTGAAQHRVRAHVDVDRDGAVSRGDFVTTAAYPVRSDETVRVAVKKV
jgi:uncharacterized lipoprotein YbaY